MKLPRFVENGQARMVGTVTRLRGGRSGIRTLSLEKRCSYYKIGTWGSVVVKALRYKSEGPGIDSRCRRDFSRGI